MTFPSLQGMTDALRLTRSGQLDQATLLLQRLCQGGAATAEAPPPPPPHASTAPHGILDLMPQRDGAGLSWALPGQPGPRPAPNPGPRPDARPAPGPARHPAAASPGGEFRALSFASPELGSRAYRLYVPSGAAAGPRPLIVMLHGCTQSPEDFAAGTGMNALAEAAGCLVAYPAQPASANPQKCWNWFKAGDQQRDRGEPGLIAGITRQVMRDHAVDPRRVYVAGLSAGGAAAAILGAVYPELYAAVGVHSGLACGAARDMPSAFAAMRQGAPATPRPGAAPGAGPRLPPAIVFHAERDGTVHPRNGEQVLAQFGAGPALQVAVQEGQVPGGHRYRVSRHSAAGETVLEHWLVLGGGHAWAGGQAAGSYTDPRGPNASREMLRFFLEHPQPARG